MNLSNLRAVHSLFGFIGAYIGACLGYGLALGLIEAIKTNDIILLVFYPIIVTFYSYEYAHVLALIFFPTYFYCMSSNRLNQRMLIFVGILGGLLLLLVGIVQEKSEAGDFIYKMEKSDYIFYSIYCLSMGIGSAYTAYRVLFYINQKLK